MPVYVHSWDREDVDHLFPNDVPICAFPAPRRPEARVTFPVTRLPFPMRTPADWVSGQRGRKPPETQSAGVRRSIA